MKKALHAFALVALLMVTACGGGDADKPPPAAFGTDPIALDSLHSAANAARSQCCSTFGPYMVNYGSSVQANPLNAFQPPPLPPADGCFNAIMNFELQFSTMAGGTYPNNKAAQDWRRDQGIATVSCVGGMMAGARLPTAPDSFPNYYLAALLISKQMAKSVPSLPPVQGYVIAMQNPRGAGPMPVPLPNPNPNPILILPAPSGRPVPHALAANQPGSNPEIVPDLRIPVGY